MANTYTPNVAFAIPALGDTGWNSPLAADLTQLDALGAIGPLAVSPAQNPSTTLTVNIAAGTFRKADGTAVAYAGAAAVALGASTTTYLWLTDAGVLTTGTTGFPASTAIVRLASVVTGTATVSSITDQRAPFLSFGANLNTVYLALAGGTLADGANLVLGTTTGTKLGTTATQKLGLWGVTPVAQRAGAGQAALGTLTTTALTDSTTGTPGTTLANVGASYTQATLNNNFASLAAQLANTVADLAAVKTLVNQIRSDLVAIGALKGSA